MVQNLKILIIAILFIPIILDGFSLEKTTTIQLEEKNYINYFKTSKVFQESSSSAKIEYSPKRKFLYITFLGEEKSNYLGLSHSREIQKSELLAVYDHFGKFVTTIGIPNSYEKAGYIKISNLQVDEDTVYIYDDSNDRISVFNFCEEDSSFVFNYLIDTRSLLGSYFFFVYNNLLFGSKPPGFLRTSNNAALIANIIKDENYKDAKYLKLTNTMFPCTEYRKMLAFDYKKEFKEAGYEVEKKNSENPNLKYIWEVISTGGVYSTVIYDSHNDTLYACNTFGSDFIKFDVNLNVKDSIRIAKFHEFRKEEINIYKNFQNTKTSFSDRYCKLIDIFFNHDYNLLILYYKLTSNMAKIKGFDKCLFVYSENKNKFITNMYPIDFIPINSFNETIVGLKFEGGKPCLLYYQIKN